MDACFTSYSFLSHRKRRTSLFGVKTRTTPDPSGPTRPGAPLPSLNGPTPEPTREPFADVQWMKLVSVKAGGRVEARFSYAEQIHTPREEKRRVA